MDVEDSAGEAANAAEADGASDDDDERGGPSLRDARGGEAANVAVAAVAVAAVGGTADERVVTAADASHGAI